MRVTFVYLDLASDNPAYTGYFHHGIASLLKMSAESNFGWHHTLRD